MSSHGRPGSNTVPTSWKALTSARLTSFKDYVVDYKTARGTSDGGPRQTWDQWARQALRKPYGSAHVQRVTSAVERVQLFPGWAARRYKDPSRANDRDAEFGIDVYVSGFASSVRPLEAATRSQKAFYRLAKGYASLPKLAGVATPPGTCPRMGPASSQTFDQTSDPDLPNSSSRPTEQTELENLEAQFREISASSLSASSSYGLNDDGDSDVLHQENNNTSFFLQKDEEEAPDQYTDSSLNSYSSSNHTEPIPPGSDPSIPISSVTPTPLPSSSSLQAELVDYAVQRLHANLDSRLQPFWSSAIPNRIIRLSIFCPQSSRVPSEAHNMSEGQGFEPEPLATQYVTTGPQGSFQATLSVPWDRLATHPPTLHVAFGDRDIEYPVIIQAEMWAPPTNSPSPASAPYSPNQRNDGSRSRPHIFSESSLALASASSPRLVSPSPGPPAVTSRITVSLPIPSVPVRLISDVDDTIKHAGVLQGAKHVFRNVFVRHLEDLVVRGMADWYKTMWQKGVRFHYVSNSPFELLPVLSEFFRVSSLPEGSLRLKSYAARSLLPALLSSPASRKRQGVVDVLDAFPESRFILVGDTGEQDMELYAELARERPDQIVGVFVRNVTTVQEYVPAGNSLFDTNSGGALVDAEPEAIESMTLDSLSSLSGSNSGTPPRYSYSARLPVIPTPKSPPLFPRSRSWGALTMEEKRQYELEARISRAQAEIPKHIAFRVFREPQECVEVQRILDHFLRVRQ